MRGSPRTGTVDLLTIVWFTSTSTSWPWLPSTPSWPGKYPRLPEATPRLTSRSIGGNLGKVNSYAGVDLSDLTGGVLNLTKLLEGNNLLCFVFEIVKTVAPNSLSTLFKIIEVPLKLVTDTLGAAILDLTCPAFKDLTVGGKSFEEGIQVQFPGAKLGASVL